jgi:ABC-2 type transport system permease protein/sodium transport system permease protein
MSAEPPAGNGPAAPAPQPSGALAPSRLIRLARKELTEILRDRRTIFTLLLMPVLLYPLLTTVLVVLGQKGTATQPPYRLGFSSQAEVGAWSAYLRRGIAALPSDPDPSATRPDLRVGEFDDVEKAVRERDVDVGFRTRAPGTTPEHTGEWDLLYREDSNHAREVVRFVQRAATAADSDLLRARLNDAGIRLRPAARLLPAPLAVEKSHTGLSLMVFVPLVLILMTITGAVYPAIDLTAGERERGTLEVLIAAPVPRVSLLFGKYVAVMTVAVLTALANLGAMTVSLLVIEALRSGVVEQVFGPDGIRVVTLLEIFLLVLLFAAFFSGVLLVLTSFARSFKEAQAYLIPLMVVAIVPGVLGLVPELPLSGPLAIVPLLNIVLLGRDLLAGHADPLGAAAVVISTAAYGVLALALAARVFGAEGVLYGQSGGWRSLLRRGERGRVSAP